MKAELVVIVAACSLAFPVAAQEYAPGEREQLVQGALPGVEGHDIAIQRVTFPAGWSGQKHTHAGPVYVYVLDGAFEVEIEGAEPNMLSAGDLVAEPQDAPMVARNASQEDPVTILLIQVSEEGRPLMELTK
jgi:quercetin dioxygenase-like cupin family protein